MSFRDFVLRGNVMDLAVAVIVGAAFNKIVDSLVQDIVNPILALIVGKPDFSANFIVLGHIPEEYKGPMTYEALKKAGVNLLGYGQFFTIIVNFLLLSFVIYQLVKYTQNLQNRIQPNGPPPTPDQALLAEIRDLLKK